MRASLLNCGRPSVQQCREFTAPGRVPGTEIVIFAGPCYATAGRSAARGYVIRGADILERLAPTRDARAALEWFRSRAHHATAFALAPLAAREA